MPKTKQKASGGGSKRLLVILIIVLIIAGLCGLAGYTFYQLDSMKSALQNQGGDVAVTKKNLPPPPPPIYVPLDAFTVSLKPGENGSERVLYIGLTLRVDDETSKETLQQFLPEVRSRLLLLFSQQTGEGLATDNGKTELLKKTKEVVNRPLTEHHKLVVTDVLFNAFILR